MTRTKLQQRLKAIVDGGQEFIDKARADRKISERKAKALRAAMLRDLDSTLETIQPLVIQEIQIAIRKVATSK